MLSLIDIEGWLDKGGLFLLWAIVFAESGLFIGFFLPGDSLLFIAGFLSSGAGDHVLPSLPWVILTTFSAAVIGDQVGYVFGRRVGPALFDRPKSRFFNPANVMKAHKFLEKHGPKTIVLARFVPIVRTFAPIVAGVGGALWGIGVTTLGYFLGEIEFVKNNLEIAILAIVGISVLPVALEFLKHRREVAATAEAIVEDLDDVLEERLDRD